MADADLPNVLKKLDQLLDLLARLRPPFRKISGEEADGSIRLIHPDELAYVITRREDDARRSASSAPPPAEEGTDGPSRPKSDDSLVVYTRAGKAYRSYATITQLRAKLEGFPGCLVTHRSYLVNLDQVLRIKITESGRELYFEGLDLPAVVSKDNVSRVEQYLGLA